MTEAAAAEPDHLAAIRTSYDTVAADYVRTVVPPTGMDSLSQAMLAAFADLVREPGPGSGSGSGSGRRPAPVADLGCGPGRITAHLAALGVPAFGVDVSGEMVELARRAYPQLRFQRGDMGALDLPDGALGGILAWYSVHHTPPRLLPALFGEFHRVLAPGGHLLLGGHVGDEHLRPTTAYGHPVSYTSHLVPADHLIDLLGRAGFTVTARLELPRPVRPDRPDRGCISLLAHT
ncbi:MULTISPECIES: class I SAM-dependent methyltransferase [Streptomyces]|uniref:class I SAM-dependent methyltransferase n=1 Tax=Streptomyces TaxID=1883 RepID=UPI0004ABA2E7|nr:MULTISPECIES: class I SAM-dependent methyltransferase [Streptomyces]